MYHSTLEIIGEILPRIKRRVEQLAQGLKIEVVSMHEWLIRLTEL